MMHVFRRLVLTALMADLILPNVPVFAAAAPAGQSAHGIISGSARTASGLAMSNIAVRLRNLRTGQLLGVTMAGEEGQFSFAALNPGIYVVEIVNATGEVVGASAMISLTDGAMVASELVVRASAASAQSRSRGGGPFFTSTWGIVTVAAIGAGVMGATVVSRNASPSK